jgi:2-methylcitrate dehydratase PrpD
MSGRTATETLADHLAQLRFDHLPPAVVDRTEDLLFDWVASAWAGAAMPAIQAVQRAAAALGGLSGPSQVLTGGAGTPYWAAFVNGAASHVVEQDDLHNASVVHPGTVVFPAALAVAQAVGASGRQLLAAAAAGYEAATRVGQFLGQSHYRLFHATGTAGALGAATAAAKLLDLDPKSLLSAWGTAGTGAAGLWEFLRTGADSKPFHAGRAAATGVLAAYLGREGLSGAPDILEGPQGMAAPMAGANNYEALLRDLGHRWAVLDTSLKWHASCRHTHPAADALQDTMARHDLSAEQIRHVTAYVTQGAMDVLGPVGVPATVHQAKFSMGFVLGLIAVRGHAGIGDFSGEDLEDPAIRTFLPRVDMVVDQEVQAAYPQQWIGKVDVETDRGRFLGRVEFPKGDPQNPIGEPDLIEKAKTLAAFGGVKGPQDVAALRQWVKDLPGARVVGWVGTPTEGG